MNLIKQLIQIPSVSGNEDKILEFIETWFKNKKIHVIRQKQFVTVCIKGRKSVNCLIFNAHVDTVSEGTSSNWTNDPFEGYETRDKIYGLGASDMKGGVASMMFVAKNISKFNLPLDVWFVFSAHEEVDGAGTMKFLQWFKRNYCYSHSAAIIGEPTNLKYIGIGHRGNIFLEAQTNGKSTHAGRDIDLKKQAIPRMVRVCHALQKIAAKWKKTYTHPMLGFPSITITSLQSIGSDSPNKTPSSCAVVVDIRTVPSIHNGAFSQIQQALSSEAQVKFMYPPSPPSICNKNETIIKAVLKSNPYLQLKTTQWSSDQCFFIKEGIPTILLGPGNPHVVHASNEFIIKENIVKAQAMYILIAQEYANLLQ